MAKIFKLLALDRWTDLNEYEGSLTVQPASGQLVCYVMLNAREWAELKVGDMLQGELTLLALTDAMQGEASPRFEQLDGVNYAVTGRIVEDAEDDVLTLDIAGLTVQADLDGHACALKKGDWVRLEGQLGLELELD